MKQESPEVVYVTEPPDPSIEVVVKQAQDPQPVKRMLGIAVPPKRKHYGW